jgi:regulator of protease activity HflC (stomatin/prohibitin superfamily)
MAEIRNFVLVRHLRSEPSSVVMRFARGRPVESGAGLSFWFLPMSTAVVEIPVDDRELSLLFHGRSADFQDVTAQGVLTYRVVSPETLARRVDFGIDLVTGRHREQPLDKIALAVTELARQLAGSTIARTPVRLLLAEGPERIRARIEEGLAADETLAQMGLELVSVRIGSVEPSPDVEKALEAPARERIQQEADEAAFARRAMAVEKERAIQENELQNRIELARREEQLIAQRGQNGRREATETAEAARIDAAATAERVRIGGQASADSLRMTEGTRVELERTRMEIYRDLPPPVLLGLAARELAGKLERIEHLNITPDLVGPLLSDLVEAGTRRLASQG